MTDDLVGSGLDLMDNALQALKIRDGVFAQQQQQCELTPYSDLESGVPSCACRGPVPEPECDPGVPPSECGLALIASLPDHLIEPDTVGFSFDEDSPPVVPLGDDEIELRSMSSPLSVTELESIGSMNIAQELDIMRWIGETLPDPAPVEWVVFDVASPVSTEQAASPRKPYVSCYSLLTLENLKDTIIVSPQETTKKERKENFAVQNAEKCTGRYL